MNKALAASRGVLLVVALTITGCGGVAGGAATPTAPPSLDPSAPATPPPATGTPTAPSTLSPPVKIAFRGSPPAGWSVNGGDGLLSFSVEDDNGGMSVDVLPNRALMAASCELGPEPGVEPSADAIAAAIANRNGLVVSGEVAATVAGLTGRQMDLWVDPEIGATCPTDEPGFVPLVGYDGAQGWEFVGVGGDEVNRLIIVDAPGDQNVVIYVAATDAATFDRQIADATSIIEGLEIG